MDADAFMLLCSADDASEWDSINDDNDDIEDKVTHLVAEIRSVEPKKPIILVLTKTDLINQKS